MDSSIVEPNIVELFEGIKTFDKVLCVIFQQDLTGKAENLKARYSHILKGLEKSLPIFDKIRKELDVPIVSSTHWADGGKGA